MNFFILVPRGFGSKCSRESAVEPLHVIVLHLLQEAAAGVLRHCYKNLHLKNSIGNCFSPKPSFSFLFLHIQNFIFFLYILLWMIQKHEKWHYLARNQNASYILINMMHNEPPSQQASSLLFAMNFLLFSRILGG